MSDKGVFRLSEKFYYTQNTDGSVILVSLENSEDQSFFEMEFGPMSDAFLRLSSGVPVSEVINRVTEEYEVDVEAVRKDLDGFIEELIKLGILERE